MKISTLLFTWRRLVVKVVSTFKCFIFSDKTENYRSVIALDSYFPAYVSNMHSSIRKNHRVLRKNKVDTYRASVFSPDYRATVLQPKCVLTVMSILSILDFYDDHK
jgi:hypothetical protein